MVNIQSLKNKILAGSEITAGEAMSLADITPDRHRELLDAAAEITARFCKRNFDSCSIANARAGRCPENCKWCAQSAHYHTKSDQYPLIEHDQCMAIAEANRSCGIGRFSLVASGRAMKGKSLDEACGYYRELSERGGMGLCASMGLLGEEELLKLRQAGVSRYHCNLETAPSFFPSLCSTHTIDDKLRTIEAARRAGMEVCSGGIIGMGESREQRIEFALALRRVEPVSIPINILIPIPGTPLENTPPIPEDEVLLTVAFFRFIHPHVTLRFAGGRARLSRATQLEALRTGINGAIVGDLLTTLGSRVAEDRELVEEAGYKF